MFNLSPKTGEISAIVIPFNNNYMRRPLDSFYDSATFEKDIIPLTK
jgi:hypothetical protein